MEISKLLNNIGYISINGIDRNIDSLAYNTSHVKPGSLFFCIEGIKTDGHIFANEAVENGACAVVVSKDVKINGDATVIRVDDTREAMALISSNFYGNPASSINVIGITGTNGKTTSTFLVKSILDGYGRKTALLGTIYNIIGDKKEEAKRTTPESMDLQELFYNMKNNGIQDCVMEVSSHSLELKRVYGTRFKAGIFTNLTQDHLDFHITMENYFNAKMKLFETCDFPVINIDDEYGRKAVKRLKVKALTFGIEKDAELRAENIKISGEATAFILRYKGETLPISLHLPGKFNVYNALGAAGACLAVGVPLDVIKKGLESLEYVPGRSEKIQSPKGFTIVIDYAHTPDGIENILKTAREYTKGRLITLFGCGGDRDKTKRSIMGRAAGELSDFCIVTSDNPRNEDPIAIINDILPGIDKTGCPYVIIEDRKNAIKYAIENGRKGDVIVIAGKGHETYQILKDKTIHFDEREIVSELLKDKD